MPVTSPARRLRPLLAFGLLGSPLLALAQETPTLDSGNTAWMLTATALVLFMTIPGLSLFYAGLVRAKNVLSVLMQCFAITALMSLLWAIYGYSLAYTDGGALQSVIGGFDKLFLAGLTVDAVAGSIPESLYMTFQMTFAIITPALIVGAFAERMKFSAMLVFMALWLTLVYVPIWHWVWGGGWIANLGAILGLTAEGGAALDFAGGTVVHINAGIAALMAAIVLGPRKGYPGTAMPPHNLGLTVMGASMLWVGWFGFNAGSELAADGVAGMALTVTQLATATAALTWMFAEWINHGKPSVLGIATGAVAGLVAITPASGTAGPMGAIAIGFAGALFAFIASTKLKRKLGYDDALDVWGVHGVAGIVGAILTGVFASPLLGGAGLAAGIDSMGAQVLIQFLSVIATLVYGGVLSLLILLVVKATMGLRVTEEQETMGLDLSQHDERGYIL
ncbi:ammonium transporter, Amt family [Allochromatium warmingii]|uniref:Ammonium transporter n=1 Tax=Allochromatium warmingii TaxID=61595 RepID=A0A1H3EJA7_ALLWA|nr:ammonium transporter [Allochromatium warmingii]SDX78852.1 ammonium transporter, Amt family [Allochromatium warmingii]